MPIRLTWLLLLVFSALSWGQLRAQCDLRCPTETDIILPAEGTIELSIFSLLDSLSRDCPPADSLRVLPNQLDCSFAGSLTPYQIRQVRTGEVLCTGVLNVKDTTDQELICREEVRVVLPENRGVLTMNQADYVFAVRDNCDRNGMFNFTPQQVDCSMVGEALRYAVMDLESKDTLCTGSLAVVDTTSTRINCKERVNIELSSSGFPTFLFPSEVIAEELKDNCRRPTDLLLSPVLLNCAMEGENTYFLTDRTTGDTLCSGVVNVIDPILPQVACQDTFQVFLAADGQSPRVSPSALVSMFSDNCGTVDQLQLAPVDSFDCSALDTLVPYDLITAGSQEVVCSGLIEVVDTFQKAIVCEEDLIVSLPLTIDGFSLTPDLFIKDPLLTCQGETNLQVFPPTVYCYHAGEEMKYSLTKKSTGDTVCVGNLRIEDTNTTVIDCADSIQVTLPRSGRPYQLSWVDVVRSFSDNCISILDLEISPRLVDCADAGQTIQYQVMSRNNSDMLCQGMIEIVDETPIMIECKETVEVRISPSGFPGILFPSRVISQLKDNCSRMNDFRTTPTFFFCPDSSATYTLIDRRSNEVACTGRVIVSGSPSPFGNCNSANQAEDKAGASLAFQLAPKAPPSLQLFPNPTQTDEIQVQLPKGISGPIHYRISDLMGAEIKEGRLDFAGGHFSLSLDGMMAGTYVFILRTADGHRMTRRFVKTR